MKLLVLFLTQPGEAPVWYWLAALGADCIALILENIDLCPHLVVDVTAFP
jgi:hypothetical protein